MIYYDLQIWVIIFATKIVARVDPITGRVVGWVDLTDIPGERLVSLAESFNHEGFYALTENPNEFFEINL